MYSGRINGKWFQSGYSIYPITKRCKCPVFIKGKDCITRLFGLVAICSYLGEVYYERPTQPSGISHFHVQDPPPKYLVCYYSVPDRQSLFSYLPLSRSRPASQAPRLLLFCAGSANLFFLRSSNLRFYACYGVVSVLSLHGSYINTTFPKLSK